MENETAAVTKQILEKITPKKEEYTKVEALSRGLEEKITSACRQ